MAKAKNKKKISVDQVHSKKKKMKASKVLNPFEIHINKEKLRVIGKKQKNDRGLPGVARSKAIQKRKRTLLQEYKIQNKSNQFMDKRIGERNSNLTEDEKVMARFTAVRLKAHNKKSIYNLADDEILTHKGHTLSEIEKFDDPRSDDEDSLEEGNAGNLDKSFVEDAHFGGGILKKTGVEGATSHKDLINQLIAESKKRKAEKQKMNEATLELTEKLDTEWKDLIPLVNTNKKTDDEPKGKLDEYDKLMRELKFEARGTVSDRLKSEDEIAKEEKDRLEQLEKERLERMKGIFPKKENKNTHRSADDLDDGIVYEDVEEPILSYNLKGEPNVEIDAQINGKQVGEDDEEESSEDESDGESEDNLSDLKADSSHSEDEIDENVEASPEVTKQKQYHDSAAVEVKGRQENGKVIKILSNIVINGAVDPQENKQQKNEEDESVVVSRSKESIKDDLLKHKEMMENARNELPYTFPLPESYETLLKVLDVKSTYHQSVIIERMIKCNHPSLAEGNKGKLGLLFAYLLQYINDLFTEVTKESIKTNCEIFNALLPPIYDLAQFHVENTHNSILEVIKEKYDDYKKKKKRHPGIELLMFLRLVSFLFSTSDARHQIVTPCFIFIEQILLNCKPVGKRGAAYGFFIVTLFLQYTVLSKRYLPAVVNYLSGILHMAIPKGGVKIIKAPHPFKSTSSEFVLLENHSLESINNLKMDITDLFDTDVDEEFKIRILYSTVSALTECHNNLKELPSCIEIFEPILRYLEMIPLQNYPKLVQEIIENFISTLKRSKEERQLQHLALEAAKPKALRLYEPKIETVYDGKRHKVQSKEKAERSKLMHKIQKEKKGALREIRRDKEFLGRVKIKHKMQSDLERKEKVKRIYAEASMQQHELNALDRKRKRKK